MATVTHAVATSSTANTTSYATAPFTPAASDLLVVFATAANTIGAGTVSNSDGLTFTRIASVTHNNNGADTTYCFVANQLANAVSQTCTFDCSADPADGAVVSVARVSGMALTGASAVRQSDTGFGGAGAAPETIFAAVCLTGNPTLGVVGQNSVGAAIVEPAGWTELHETTFATPDREQESCSRNSGFTGTTLTWSGQDAAHGEIAIELDTTGAAAEAVTMLSASVF